MATKNLSSLAVPTIWSHSASHREIFKYAFPLSKFSTSGYFQIVSVFISGSLLVVCLATLSFDFSVKPRNGPSFVRWFKNNGSILTLLSKLIPKNVYIQEERLEDSQSLETQVSQEKILSFCAKQTNFQRVKLKAL